MDALAVITAYVLGAVPFSQIVSVRVAGTDLRSVGTGTVSGTGLYRIAGLWPLILGGGLDVLKGVVAALLAGDDAALAVGVSAAVVIGHCWSVFLRGAGGRGISPALGTLAVLYWPGAALLLAGLVIGRLVKETGLAALLGDVAMVALLGVSTGAWGVALGLAVVLPMLVKRVVGNTRSESAGLRVYVNRLLFDADRHNNETAMDAAALEKVVRLLADRFERHREELNRLNVYPVPDGDTGDNLAALTDAVLERLSGSEHVAGAVASGALHGGRGSSGVIFGQALRAFVANIPADAAGLASALTAAAAAARDAVADPVEGTILTVAADAAREAETMASSDGSQSDVARAAAAEGRRSLARTPDLLPALGGTLDAGGLGYVLFLDALAEVLTGATRPPVELPATDPLVCRGDTGGGRYEVICLLAAGEDEVARLRQQWLSLGDTVVIAGGIRTWRCHVHTDDVDEALAAARRAGAVSEVEITDLAGQVGGKQ
jgi:glycerol-3-phosphate acyltransferase PlsY